MGCWEPFHLITKHIQFLILHLCSASNVQHRQDWGCDLTLKKIPGVPWPTPHSTCSDIFHRRKKEISIGLSFLIFWQRFLSWIRCALYQWLTYFLFRNAPFHSSVLISSGGGKVWLLKENTICNSRRFIYCIYNTQGCSKSLIIWLCYLILSFQKCLITLSWENLTNYNYCSALKPSMWLDEWQTYCVSMVTALVRVTFCCSMFEFRQPLWSWNASVKELACG